MTTTVDLSWGSVNIDAADPARLADFWGKVLGRPVRPGFTPGTMTVDASDSGSGLQMVIVLAAEPVKVGGGFCPNLFTDHHDEETEAARVSCTPRYVCAWTGWPARPW